MDAPLEPAEQMWDAFDDAYAESGLKEVSRVSLSQKGKRQLEIDVIDVNLPARGQGVGNKILSMLTSLADQYKVGLTLSPAEDADGDLGLDYDGLIQWYEKWGFEMLRAGRMGRYPQS
jgi:GNAT superfamily N-acetyltransferase